MKKTINSLFSLILISISLNSNAQEMVNPIIKGYGGIYEVSHATETPDSDMQYDIVIDVVTGSQNPERPMYSLVNVARLLNLHAVGGVPKENLHVVLVIHGGAIWSVLDNVSYQEKYDVDNPHIALFEELSEAGVKIFVCAQSLMARGIDYKKLAPDVKVATSMLTTLTTYQLKGYAALKF